MPLENGQEIACVKGQPINLLEHVQSSYDQRLNCIRNAKGLWFGCHCPNGFIKCEYAPECASRQQQPAASQQQVISVTGAAAGLGSKFASTMPAAKAHGKLKHPHQIKSASGSALGSSLGIGQGAAGGASANSGLKQGSVLPKARSFKEPTVLAALAPPPPPPSIGHLEGMLRIGSTTYDLGASSTSSQLSPSFSAHGGHESESQLRHIQVASDVFGISAERLLEKRRQIQQRLRDRTSTLAPSSTTTTTTTSTTLAPPTTTEPPTPEPTTEDPFVEAATEIIDTNEAPEAPSTTEAAPATTAILEEPGYEDDDNRSSNEFHENFHDSSNANISSSSNTIDTGFELVFVLLFVAFFAVAAVVLVVLSIVLERRSSKKSNRSSSGSSSGLVK